MTDLEAMRRLGKAGLVEKAIEQVRRRKPDFALGEEYKDYGKVHASQRTLKVVLQPVFLAAGNDRQREVRKEDLEVRFTKDAVFIQPDEFLGGSNTLDDRARKMLSGVLKQKTPQVGERFTIYEMEGGIEVQVSRGYSGGTERYRIDPQTGEWHMLWHEHPMPPMKMGPIVELRKDGTTVELEEEVFQELK